MQAAARPILHQDHPPVGRKIEARQHRGRIRPGSRPTVHQYTAMVEAGDTDAINLRFDVDTQGVLIDSSAALQRELADAEVVLATAAAGVQVLAKEDLPAAGRMLVAADVNAVPPAGIAGVDVQHDGVPLEGTKAVGIGALAVGNVKYQVQHRLFVRMLEAAKPVFLGFPEALEMARELVADGSAG